MNVLYVGTYPPHPGGSAIVMAQVLERLQALGWRVRVLAPITAASVAEGARFALRHPAIDVTRFLVPHYETSPDQPAPDSYREIEADGARRELGRLVERERPDVVISGRETFGLHVPAAAQALGLPTLQVVHGGTTTGMLQRRLSSATSERLLAGLRLADRIVSVARHLAATYGDLGFDHVEAIQNGVDLGRFAPQPKSARRLAALGVPEDRLVLGHASNVKPLKRPMDLLDLAEYLGREGLDFVVLVMGDGPLRPAMEDACHARGLTARFRFAGWIDHDDMPEYLNLTDIVVMPSESEALSLVYLEVLACGRVLLASDIDAAREVVASGIDGVLFRCGDTADLGAHALALARDPLGRQSLGANARRTAEGHSLDETAASYARVLEEIARRRRALPA